MDSLPPDPPGDLQASGGPGVPEAASSAPGAQAPQDEVVVSMADAKTRKKRGAAAGGASSSASPSPQENASSRAKGKGGGSKKPPKEPDWGKYNYLHQHFALIYGTDTVWDGA